MGGKNANRIVNFRTNTITGVFTEENLIGPITFTLCEANIGESKGVAGHYYTYRIVIFGTDALIITRYDGLSRIAGTASQAFIGKAQNHACIIDHTDRIVFLRAITFIDRIAGLDLIGLIAFALCEADVRERQSIAVGTDDANRIVKFRTAAFVGFAGRPVAFLKTGTGRLTGIGKSDDVAVIQGHTDRIVHRRANTVQFFLDDDGLHYRACTILSANSKSHLVHTDCRKNVGGCRFATAAAITKIPLVDWCIQRIAAIGKINK